MESLANFISPRDVFMNVFWFGICLVLFTILARLSPNIKNQPLWRKDAITDATYWFIMPLFYGKISQFFVAVGLVVIFSGNEESIQKAVVDGFGPLSKQPLWLQVFLAVLFQDFMMYWLHRWFHKHRMWKFHAIHHCSEQIDWLSTSRFHPVNLIIYSVLTAAIVFCMGFSPLVFVILGPINVLFSSLVHANLNWTYGPFRYVIASPVFHRWHHTSQEEGRDKNFAPTFPFLDVIFGTFYMPKGKLPETFGVDDPVPDDFIGQLKYPFTVK
jgi:sterol desaturase/sphingolipid hydroxylase (fatty acid hydroxylase superfamily)